MSTRERVPFSSLDQELEAWLFEFWSRVENESLPTLDPWRLVMLATVDRDEPTQRMLVVRSANRDQPHIIMHTDRRSAKCDQIAINNSGSLAWYDPDERVQVVARTTMKLVTDQQAISEQWNATPASSRRAYLALSKPGQPAESPTANLPEEMQDRVPTEAELEEGFANFAVIECTVSHIDILQLTRAGNLRCEYSWTNGTWLGTWITP